SVNPKMAGSRPEAPFSGWSSQNGTVPSAQRLDRAYSIAAQRASRHAANGDQTMQHRFALDTANIAIVGLGYVGLPLAVEFGKQYDTVGFDTHAGRVEALAAGHDSTLEVEPELLASA